MKFKVDENLPTEFADMLCSAGHEALTAFDQQLQGRSDPDVVEACVREERVLVTLDLDFSDIRAYPPEQFPGFIVLRTGSQDKPHLIDVFRQAITQLVREPLANRLWIVEEGRIRIRGEKDRGPGCE